MAPMQNVSEHVAMTHFESGPFKQSSNPFSENPVVDATTTADDACFECNICFDSARDPVVTRCGHLYCWPCIYRWFRVQSSSRDSDRQHQSCPICKADISCSSLIPLYGRGPSSSEPESKESSSDLNIPRRPSPCSRQSSRTSASIPGLTSHPVRQQQDENTSMMRDFDSTWLASSGPTTTVGMYGEMVYARIFGGSDMSRCNYPYSYCYPEMANSDRRARRREMKLEQSLNRVSIFLLCCIIFCLLLF